MRWRLALRRSRAAVLSTELNLAGGAAFQVIDPDQEAFSMGRSIPPKRIIVIEPDKDTRDLSAVLFEEAELGVIECDTWRDALAILDRQPEGVAMVFGDLDGDAENRRLAGEVRRLWPDVRLVLTGSPRNRKGLPDDASYMPKPWRALEVLIAAETAAGLRH